MKDMFYNYEHNVNTESPNFPPYSKQKELNTCSNVKRLLNAKGDEIGVEGKVNSKFYLYFNIEGTVTDENGEFEATLREVLESANIYFDVLDSKRDVVASFVPELSYFADEIRVQVYTSEEGPLKYGVYRMHLYFETEEGIFTLFSEEDGILSIA